MKRREPPRRDLNWLVGYTFFIGCAVGAVSTAAVLGLLWWLA